MTFQTRATIKTVWDDPFGIDSLRSVNAPYSFMGSRQYDVPDINFIRDQQRALVPVLGELLEAAREITNVPHKMAELKAATTVKVKISYRLPDHEQIINPNSFSYEMDDEAVAIPVYGQQSRAIPAIDRLFPLQAVQKILEPEITVPKDVMGAIIRLTQEQVDDEGMPDKQRVVFPNMMRFLKGWISNIDGLIHNVGYSVSRPEFAVTQQVSYGSARLN